MENKRSTSIQSDEGVLLMEVTNVRVRRVKGEGKLRAYCSVEFDRMLTVELRVMEGVHGLFVSMPSQKGKDGKYWDLVYPSNADMRQAIQTAVLGTYRAMAEAAVHAPEEGALLPQEEPADDNPFGNLDATDDGVLQPEELAAIEEVAV